MHPAYLPGWWHFPWRLFDLFSAYGVAACRIIPVGEEALRFCFEIGLVKSVLVYRQVFALFFLSAAPVCPLGLWGDVIHRALAA